MSIQFLNINEQEIQALSLNKTLSQNDHIVRSAGTATASVITLMIFHGLFALLPFIFISPSEDTKVLTKRCSRFLPQR